MITKMDLTAGISFSVFLAFFASNSAAFQLQPSASDTEKNVRVLESSFVSNAEDNLAATVLEHFSHPIHEEITYRIFGCSEPPNKTCQNKGSMPLPSKALLYGVQWNDNPPFQLKSSSFSDCPLNTTIRLPNFSKCWYKLFKDAEGRAPDEYFDSTTPYALIYRVHFGDLQFLHSMASWDGVPAHDTKSKIMAWAELTYRVSIGDLSPSTKLIETGIEEIENTFFGNGWTVEGILTLGQDQSLRRDIREIAFGSLLHMVQDSFAEGHVLRDTTTVSDCKEYPGLRKAGEVHEFHSYEHQDKAKHKEKDSREALQAELLVQDPSVVDVGRALLRMRTDGKQWGDVRSYFDSCIYPLPNGFRDHPAGPGTEFKKEI